MHIPELFCRDFRKLFLSTLIIRPHATGLRNNCCQPVFWYKQRWAQHGKQGESRKKQSDTAFPSVFLGGVKREITRNYRIKKPPGEGA